jgi:hypothetical protein
MTSITTTTGASCEQKTAFSALDMEEPSVASLLLQMQRSMGNPSSKMMKQSSSTVDAGEELENSKTTDLRFRSYGVVSSKRSREDSSFFGSSGKCVTVDHISNTKRSFASIPLPKGRPLMAPPRLPMLAPGTLIRQSPAPAACLKS